MATTPRRHKVDCAEYGHFIIESTGHIISKHINELPCADTYHDIIKFDVAEWKRNYNADSLPERFDFSDLGFWYKPDPGKYSWRHVPACNDWRAAQYDRK